MYNYFNYRILYGHNIYKNKYNFYIYDFLISKLKKLL